MNATKTQYSNPQWWSKDDDSAWERTKAAFKRDWDQTKHDFGGNEPDTDQNVSDTVKQAAGSEAIPARGEPNFEEYEPAYRFGFGARQHYQSEYSEWNDQAEERLKRDWTAANPTSDWKKDRQAIQQGWDYDEEA